MRKMFALVATGILVALSTFARADEGMSKPVPTQAARCEKTPCSSCCNERTHAGRVWDWLTYHSTCHSCACNRREPTPRCDLPPFVFFLDHCQAAKSSGTLPPSPGPCGCKTSIFACLHRLVCGSCQ